MPTSATASVTSVTYKQGAAFLNVTLAIPKKVDRQARNKGRDHEVRVRVSYTSGNGTVESLDSGAVPIATGTTFVAAIDAKTVSVLLQVQLGTSPPPGAAPNYQSSVELMLQANSDDDDDTDDDDGPDHH